SRDLGREPAALSDPARLALEAHTWDGNVRELRSVMERAALVCKGDLVEAADLAFEGEREDGPLRPASVVQFPTRTTLRDLERDLLLRTLALADGNQSRAARLLGLHESTLRFRLRRAGIPASKRAASGS